MRRTQLQGRPKRLGLRPVGVVAIGTRLDAATGVVGLSIFATAGTSGASVPAHTCVPGPNPDLRGCNFAGADLSEVYSGDITGTPASLPTDWTLVDDVLIGQDADLKHAELEGADLEDANLTEADLDGANLDGANLTGVRWGDTTCPDGTNSNNDGDTCVNDLG